jgi:hypothetical protein
MSRIKSLKTEADVFKLFDKELALRNLSPATRRAYRGVLRGYFRQTRVQPSEVCRENIRDYMLSQIERKLSASSLAIIAAALRLAAAT